MSFRIIGLDIFRNCIRKIWIYLALIGVTFYECFEMLESAKVLGIKDQLSIHVLAAGLYRGMEEYIPSPQDPFEMPVTWLLFYILLLFTVFSGFYKNDESPGLLVLCGFGRRTRWMKYRIYWALGVTTIYYVIQYLVLFLFCLLFKISFVGWGEAQTMKQLFDLEVIGQWEMPLPGVVIYVLPLLWGYVFSLCCVLLSQVINKAVSLIILLIYIMVSVYFFHPVFIGSYGMVLRNRAVLEGNGYNEYVGIGLLIGILLCVVIITFYRFRKKDLLKDVG